MRLIDADELDNVVAELNTKRGYEITRNEYKLISNVLFEFPKEDVFDKITAEIKEYCERNCIDGDIIADELSLIIDKYRREG